jgi:hypothetical protein
VTEAARLPPGVPSADAGFVFGGRAPRALGVVARDIATRRALSRARDMWLTAERGMKKLPLRVIWR